MLPWHGLLGMSAMTLSPILKSSTAEPTVLTLLVHSCETVHGGFVSELPAVTIDRHGKKKRGSGLEEDLIWTKEPKSGNPKD